MMVYNFKYLLLQSPRSKAMRQTYTHTDRGFYMLEIVLGILRN